MSEPLYELGGLRFWNEREITLREQAVQMLYLTVSKALCGINAAWTFHRVEGPILTPRRFINSAYDEGDIYLLHAKLGDDGAALRAETTASSYLYAQHVLKTTRTRPPLCVWQAGKSFRRETQDGARWSTLRLNEFYQIEFQCIYAVGTAVDYREVIEPQISHAIRKLTHAPIARMVDSERLPVYSSLTRDVEVPITGAMPPEERKWKEMASISSRTDFPQPTDPNQKRLQVLEIAIGLDRLIAVEGLTEHRDGIPGLDK